MFRALLSKKSAVIISQLIFLLFFSNAVHAKRNISVCVYENAPLVYQADNDSAGGLSVDVLNYIGSQEGWKINYIFGSWQECLYQLNGGDTDLQVAIISTPEREKKYDFSKEFVFTLWGQVYTKRNAKIESILDLQEKHVAVYKGSVPAKRILELTKSFNIDINVQEFSDYNSIGEAVSSGKADAGVFVRSFGEKYSESYDLLRTAIIFNPLHLRYAVLKNTNQDLLFAIDRHLKSMKLDKSSSYYTALEKNIGPNGSSSLLPKWVKPALFFSVASALVFFVVLLSQRLVVREKVKEIAERKEAREKLQNLTRKLKAAHQLGKTSWWEYDIVNDTIFWPEETYELYGIGSEVKLDYDTLLEMIHSDYQVQHNAQLKQIFQTGKADFKYPIRRPDGKERWIWARGEAEYDDQGQPVRLFGTLQDITDQHNAEVSLVSAKLQAEAANHSKSVFLSNMSHELRTPLNAILGYTQIFAADETLNAKQQSGVSTIHKAGEHLLLIINDILDMSKIESGKLELVNSEVQLEPFFRSIIDFFQFRAQEKGVDFTFEACDTLPTTVMLDELRLRQIIINLLSNAFKFTSKGYCQLQIKTEDLEENTLRLTISVRDSGVGIEKDKQEEIFEPFKQVGDRLQYSEGSGLGLAISRQLVHLMGGQLSLVSPANTNPKDGEGAGSCFSFTIETEIILGANLQHQPIKVVSGYQQKSGQMAQLKVLVVDDKESNRVVLRDTLTPLGFEVEEIGDGCAVPAISLQIQPDIILMDLRMPKCDGFSALTQLRNIDELKTIPVIAITASTAEEEILAPRCLEHGFNGFIQKPFVVSDLLKSMEKLLPIKLTYKTSGADGNEQSRECQKPPTAVTDNLANHLAKGDISRISELVDEIALMEGGLYRDYCEIIKQLADDFNVSALEKMIHPNKRVE